MCAGGIGIAICPFMIGKPVLEIDGVGTADGIRTTGRVLSAPGTPMRETIESTGDLMPSLKVDAPMDDFRLMAMLGVYALPYMLGLRLP